MCIQDDISWWLRFSEFYNGVSMMPPLSWEKPDKSFSMDASLVGGGGYCSTGPDSAEYFHCVFPQHVIDAARHINSLEIFTVRLACMLWGKLFRGRNILIWCDNMSTVQTIRGGNSRDPFMQNALRDILYVAAKYEFQIRVVHLDTLSNRISDSLSRFSLSEHYKEKFFEDTKGVLKTERQIPSHFFDLSCKW